MTRLYLVRHGKSAAGFDEAHDPDLAPRGAEQAKAVAQFLVDRFSPMPVLTSPLLRARRTAEPLATRWERSLVLEPCMTEIPCPIGQNGEDLAARRPWLTALMAQRYGALGPDIQAWRTALIDRLLALRTDSVIFTHFLTMNAALGHVQDDDRVVVFDPGYCNIMELAVDSGALHVNSTSLWCPA